MKPLRLRAENFRTYRSLDLRFNDGMSVILGQVLNAPEGLDSNGSGKSSLLEAIDICLFGRRSLAGLLTRGGDVTELMLELTFEHAGETYRVRRGYSARTKTGKTIPPDFERAVRVDVGHGPTGDWLPLTCESGKQTDALIVETIGLSLDAYRNSSYLRQNAGSFADPARDPKQRKELLVEAGLGRDPIWPRVRDAAKNERSRAQAGLERVAGETRAARELVETSGAVTLEHAAAIAAEEQATTTLAAAETELQATIDRYDAAKDGAARRQTCEAELAAAKQADAALDQRTATANDAARQIAATITRLEELGTAPDTERLELRVTQLETTIEAHREAVRAHETATAAAHHAESVREQHLTRAAEFTTFAEAARVKAEELERVTDEKTCDHCGQTLTDEARLRAIASYVAEAATHDQAARAARGAAMNCASIAVPPAPEGVAPTEELRTVGGQLRAAQIAAQERAALKERITQLENAAASGPLPDQATAAKQLVFDKQAELDDIEPVNLTAIEQAGSTARAQVTLCRSALDVVKATKARLDERLAQIAKAEEVLASAAVLERELQTLVDEQSVVEKACGRDGIPALIIENRVIPYLETEATRILGELGIGFSVELRTQEEKKDGSGLKDTLTVVVFDRDGNEADFAEGTSGGEQTRVGFVLQIALAEYLALTGRGSRLLAVDEPPYLDRSGLTALTRVLEQFVADGVFDQVLVVSHDAELRDSVEQTITVINDGGRSRIDGAEVLEPVEELAA